MKRPVVYIGASMFISLFIFSYLGISAVVVLFVVSAIVLLPVFFLKNRNRVFRKILCVCISVLISSVLFSAKTIYEYHPAMQLCDDNKHSVSGNLVEYEKKFGMHYYTVDNVFVDGKPIKHKMRMKSDIYKNAQIDDVISCSDMVIYELGMDENVFLNNKANGVYLGAYTYNSFFTVGKTQTHSALYYLQSVRRYITETLHENMPSEFASVTNALLTGDDSAIEYETECNFRFSGIAHLFAVSGFHLALWTSMLYVLFSKIFRKHTAVTNALIILFVLFFMALTGFTQSVVRAGIMQIIMILGKIIKFRKDSLNSLFFALTLILTVNPFAVTSLSLQMSFLATLGIVVFADAVTDPIQKLKLKTPGFLYYIISTVYTTLAVSIVASLFIMVVSALNFGYYCPIAPVSNVFCMPASQILMPVSVVAVIIAPVSFIAKPLFALCNLLAEYLIAVTSFISHLPYAVTNTDTVAVRILIVIMFFVIIICTVIFKEKNRSLRKCIAISTAMMLLISAGVAIIEKNSYEISVADVSNGTAVILRTGKTDAFIGCGGNRICYYKLTNIAEKVNEREFDMILIPRNSETESVFAEDILETYAFDSCIIADEHFSARLMKNLPENTIITSETAVVLDENTTLIYINNERFSGARIESSDFNATILFRPICDFSAVDEKWQTGDLLITRQSLPEISTEGFVNVIVSTSAETIYDAENIFSTKNLGSIRYAKFLQGGVSVNAV